MPETIGGQKTIIILLVALFFGCFGAHNFMMGEKKKAILRLATCWFGLGGILALYDIFMIVSGKYQVSADVLF